MGFHGAIPDEILYAIVMQYAMHGK